jgi:hypothetical protein
MRTAAVLTAIVIGVSGCSSTAETGQTGETTSTVRVRYSYGEAPVVGSGATPDASAAFARVVQVMSVGEVDVDALADLVDSGDARHAWLISDVLRFTANRADVERLGAAFISLTGRDITADPTYADNVWTSATNHLLAWDIPAPDDYRELKASLFTLIEPAWRPFFDDNEATIDWRWVSWGGVLADERPLGDSQPCSGGCIPALDDPALTDAASGDWYPDDSFVFGVVIGDEAVAFPKNILEVHEMVNITIGGRRLGIPYCTLCGSAQAFYTDEVPDGVDVPVLRTSGLLSRSNKVMYDLITESAFDTFTGEAVTGPLRAAGVVLQQATVEVSRWSDWKQAHPETHIIAEDGGIGRSYDPDPLRGRDDNGPIFPIGSVDDRLGVQEQVVGVITPDGTAIAFPAAEARDALDAGRTVSLAGVELSTDGGGLRATFDGAEVASHQAFWFAWSQFHPGSELWQP